MKLTKRIKEHITMLIPIALNQDGQIVTIADIDTNFQVTNKRKVGIDTFNKLIANINDPLDSWCCKEELFTLQRLNYEGSGRILRVVGDIDSLNSNAMITLSTGKQGTIGELRKATEVNSPDIELLGRFFNKRISKISGIRWKQGYEVLNIDGSYTKASIAQNKTMFIWTEQETGYPVPLLVLNYPDVVGIVYRLGILQKFNTNKGFGLTSNKSSLSNSILLGQSNREWEYTKELLRQQTDFVYPLLDDSNLQQLLTVLHNISQPSVLPFYLAYRKWESNKEARRISLMQGNYWSVQSEDSSNFTDTLSIFGQEFEVIRTIKNNKFYGANTMATTAIKVIGNIHGDAQRYKGYAGYAFMNLSNLYLEKESLNADTHGLVYYLKDMVGADTNYFCKRQFFDDMIYLYIAPDKDVDKLLDIVYKPNKSMGIIVLLNYNEWCTAGLKQELQDFLSKTTLLLLDRGSTHNNDIKFRFISEPVGAKGEIWDETVKLETDFSFWHLKYSITVYNKASKIGETVFKLLLQGMVNSLVADYHCASDTYKVISHTTEENNKETSYVRERKNTIAANIGGIHHEITLDRDIATVSSLAYSLCCYIDLRTGGAELQWQDELLDCAHLIYSNYVDHYEEEFNKMLTAELIENLSTGTLTIKEVIPKEKCDALFLNLSNFSKELEQC